MDTVQWKTSNPAVATISRGDGSGVGEISAIASGTATITASVSGVVPVQYNVTVYPEGTDLGVLPPAIYLTTGQNVGQFTHLNAKKRSRLLLYVFPLRITQGSRGYQIIQRLLKSYRTGILQRSLQRQMVKLRLLSRILSPRIRLL